MSFHALLGIVAGILAFTAMPIYVIDIFRGNTKPSRVTWWILSGLNALLALSYYASGARDTIWVPIVYSVIFLIVAILSLKYGDGGWEKSDFLCLLGAAISALAWWLLASPQIALFLIILVDFFGLVPTIYKSYREPETESRISWSIALVASLLNILAIEVWVPEIAVYPFYVFITNLMITYFILRPFRKGEKKTP